MLKIRTKPIKPMLGFTKVTPPELMARAVAVHTGISGDPADYPAPPVEMPTFKEAIDTYSSMIAGAMDGGRKAITERNHQAEVVVRMLRQLGHYVEVNCRGDMTAFLKSGFQAPSTAKVTFQPLSQFIRKIAPGANSGQLLVTLASVPGALSYELRWGANGTGGTPDTWTSRPVGKTRPAASVTGLTPGTAYVIQVRAVLQSGYSDWSDPVTRICT